MGFSESIPKGKEEDNSDGNSEGFTVGTSDTAMPGCKSKCDGRKEGNSSGNSDGFTLAKSDIATLGMFDSTIIGVADCFKPGEEPGCKEGALLGFEVGGLVGCGMGRGDGLGVGG